MGRNFGITNHVRFSLQGGPRVNSGTFLSFAHFVNIKNSRILFYTQAGPHDFAREMNNFLSVPSGVEFVTIGQAWQRSNEIEFDR